MQIKEWTAQIRPGSDQPLALYVSLTDEAPPGDYGGWITDLLEINQIIETLEVQSEKRSQAGWITTKISGSFVVADVLEWREERIYRLECLSSFTHTEELVPEATNG